MLRKRSAAKKIEKVFCGRIIHAVQMGEIEIFDGGIGVASDGTIAFVCKDAEERRSLVEYYDVEKEQIVDLGAKFLIPGLIDTHCHAPQYLYAGICMSHELLIK
jgi:guanine deaminase